MKLSRRQYLRALGASLASFAARDATAQFMSGPSYFIRPAFSTDQMVKPWSQGGSLAGSATIQNNYNAEGAYTAFRLGYGNYTTSPQTITKAIAAAPYGYDTDGFTPLNSGGSPDNTLWSAVAGAAGLVVPPGSGSSPNLIWNYVFTPWQSLPSVARLDAGVLPLFAVRSYTTLGSAYGLAPQVTPWASINQGRTMLGYLKFADGVTNPANFAGATGPQQSILPSIVQLRLANRGLGVAAAGNSLTQGYGTTSDQNSWGFQACCSVSTPSRPVSWANFGIAGSVSTTFYQNALDVLAVATPDVFCFPVFTPNDPITQPAMDAAFSRAIAIAQQCVRAGIIPVLWTPMPDNQTGANQTMLLAQRNRTLVLRNQGMLVPDFYNVLNDPANPGHILVAYQSATQGSNHPNDAGDAACAVELVNQALNPCLAMYP